MEQQGELIRFLQRRCDNLAREVLHLQAREDRYIQHLLALMCNDRLLPSSLALMRLSIQGFCLRCM